MNDKLLKIINYYGVKNQAKKLIEEGSELLEAIVEYETLKTTNNAEEIEIAERHVVEEFTDCNVVLSQIGIKHEINPHEVEELGAYKVDRTLNRMNFD